MSALIMILVPFLLYLLIERLTKPEPTDCQSIRQAIELNVLYKRADRILSLLGLFGLILFLFFSKSLGPLGLMLLSAIVVSRWTLYERLVNFYSKQLSEKNPV